MKILTLNRFHYTGMLWIPKEDTSSSGGNIILTYEKDIVFAFSGSPSTPRSVVVANEPFPAEAVITNIRNKYDEPIMPGGEYTITVTEPILNPWGRVEGYKHQVALSNRPDFGYDIVRGSS